VGIVDQDQLIDGHRIRPGDRLIGLASSGLHSNGFSLVRKDFFTDQQFDPRQVLPELGVPLGEELFKPTRIYVKSIVSLLKKHSLTGWAHITGGGIVENLPRILPGTCQARIQGDSWDIPPIFPLLKRLGAVSEEEMWRVFNNGVGMILVVSADQTLAIQEELFRLGEKAFLIGEIIDRPESGPAVLID
ncbi:MAG TPA: AIR synthase-related protein, partial [Thermodesulfobacteriota bacterium]|nr:AIR synthase-related protein [Thermodesulfobacteriota bacterium]